MSRTTVAGASILWGEWRTLRHRHFRGESGVNYGRLGKKSTVSKLLSCIITCQWCCILHFCSLFCLVESSLGLGGLATLASAVFIRGQGQGQLDAVFQSSTFWRCLRPHWYYSASIIIQLAHKVKIIKILITHPVSTPMRPDCLH